MKYKNVVWDWNGTLLDDVAIGHATLCRMLERRGLKPITLEEYKDLFGFPVKDFYEVIGFDFSRDNWHEVSLDFVETYDGLAGGVTLTPGAETVLGEIQQAGIKQYILSALNETSLTEMVFGFGINERFERLCGSDNIYADGKVCRGQRMLNVCGINPEETLMVGDTLHDGEVAEALGFDFILYSGGHNSEWRLREKGQVITELKGVTNEICRLGSKE